ncbi:hypothetical protein AAFF_G00429420, partial [Aldrovandia affinis]
EDHSPERCINLLHCLSELNDDSLEEVVQQYLSSGEEISPAHCSALAYMLLNSEKVLDELDVRKYNTSDYGRRRLIPVVKHCRKAVLSGCDLTGESCEIVASALHCNNLGDSGVELLCAALSKLHTLRLRECNLTEGCCDAVASVLRSHQSDLRELELRDNDLQDSGVRALSAGLEDPHCKLQRLGLSGCGVTQTGCASLASALRSNPSHLRVLDLSYNHPGDSGGLEDPSCKLETLLVDHGGEIRIKPRLRKYACQLTLDPNTAHRRLSLSEGDRKVTRGRERQPYPHHQERFEGRPQVLCREGLSERCYWEAEWSVEEGRGWAVIGVAYKGISRGGHWRGFGFDSPLGFDETSWSLHCSNDRYTAWHKGNITRMPAPSSCRVGVYLDWPAGTLSFYSVSSDTLTHLHTYHSTFTEPLYPGFGVYSTGSVSLCMLG